MLFTRCPDCDTTFRVTDEALKKANGQVRCGRCASVFNAYAELHDPTAVASQTSAAGVSMAAAPTAAPTAIPAPGAPTPAAAAAHTRAAAPTPASTRAAQPTDPAAAGVGTTSVADVVAEIALGEADENAITGELAVVAEPSHENAISARQVDDVLATAPAPLEREAPVWARLGAEPATQRSSRAWGVAAACALLALGLQGLHHFRAALASHAVVGPWVQEAYGALGATVTPNWDVRQYEILDWVASAEPNSRGLGSLKITARIQNHGPQQQPYPAVNLRLKDRWEEAVGSRLFAPAEYLPRDTPRGRLMAAGETVRAEIEVVDPGPDAYGFELDICVEVEADALSCGTDKVFR